jgi:Raf kinase inhibitor-like YbhB/YbcL family protein
MRKVELFSMSLLLLMCSAVTGCAQTAPPEEKAPPGGDKMPFIITSPAFADGAKVPVKYTCDGQNILPVLDWADSPAGTVSFALILEDPDAPVKNFTHWVIFNLPPDVPGLPEAVPRDGTLAIGALQGKNGGGGIGYIGPCPPKGLAHHYVFNLYALNKPLDLAAGATKDQVLEAIGGHILAQSQFVGLYQRQ